MARQPRHTEPAPRPGKTATKRSAADAMSDDDYQPSYKKRTTRPPGKRRGVDDEGEGKEGVGSYEEEEEEEEEEEVEELEQDEEEEQDQSSVAMSQYDPIVQEAMRRLAAEQAKKNKPAKAKVKPVDKFDELERQGRQRMQDLIKGSDMAQTFQDARAALKTSLQMVETSAEADKEYQDKVNASDDIMKALRAGISGFVDHRKLTLNEINTAIQHLKQRPAAISKTLERLEEIKNAKHKQISANMAADIQSHDVVRSAKRAVTWRK